MFPIPKSHGSLACQTLYHTASLENGLGTDVGFSGSLQECTQSQSDCTNHMTNFKLFNLLLIEIIQPQLSTTCRLVGCVVAAIWKRQKKCYGGYWLQSCTCRTVEGNSFLRAGKIYFRFPPKGKWDKFLLWDK